MFHLHFDGLKMLLNLIYKYTGSEHMLSLTITMLYFNTMRKMHYLLVKKLQKTLIKEIKVAETFKIRIIKRDFQNIKKT